MYDYYDYDIPSTTGNTLSGLGALGGLALGFIIVFAIILIALVVFMIIAEVKLYKKAGKAGWEAIVPFYSQWVYVEIAGLNWWWFLVAIGGTLLANVSDDLSGLGYLVSLFGMFVCNFNVAKKFHKDTGFAVLMTLFPVVLFPMLGFGKSYEFDSSVEVTPNGPFDANKATNTNTTVSTNNNSGTTDEKKEAKVESKSVKFCPNCGGSLDGDKFCPNCGSKVDE